MANNGAALLGGLLIGGLVVGAAMSAEDAGRRQNRRNYANYNRQPRVVQQQRIQPTTYCICGAKMVQGRIQQGIAKCNNLNCQKILTGSVCYYCPNGGKVQQHRNGFFYCEGCAFQLKTGNRVQPKPVQAQYSGNAYPAQIKNTNKAYVVKQGYMSKKGNWFNTGYKKRWFKLWSNRKMAYLTHPGASYTKGYADFTHVQKMEKKGKHGFEITTSERVWSFLCQSEADRNSWFLTIQTTCTNVKPVMKQPPMQVKYVPAPQVQYVQPQQPIYAQPQPQPQPQIYKPQPQPVKYEQKQEAQPGAGPGSFGYNSGNMYGSGNNNNGAKQWQSEQAPPPAYMDPSAPSAPPEDDVAAPSAPPAEDEQEGAYTGQ